MISKPISIAPEHQVDAFDCGEEALNAWLQKRALKNVYAGGSRTYVVCMDKTVIGYYCLATGVISRVDAPKAMQRNMPEPIPVLVMGRLAIDQRYQNQGIGRALMREAVLRSFQAAEIVGVKALLVHALSEQAKRFYLSCGFIQSPTQPMTLCLILKTLEEMFGAN